MQVRFKFITQFELLSSNRSPITLGIESIIISIDSDVTDNTLVRSLMYINKGVEPKIKE